MPIRLSQKVLHKSNVCFTSCTRRTVYFVSFTYLGIKRSHWWKLRSGQRGNSWCSSNTTSIRAQLIQFLSSFGSTQLNSRCGNTIQVYCLQTCVRGRMTTKQDTTDMKTFGHGHNIVICKGQMSKGSAVLTSCGDICTQR